MHAILDCPESQPLCFVGPFNEVSYSDHGRGAAQEASRTPHPPTLGGLPPGESTCSMDHHAERRTMEMVDLGVEAENACNWQLAHYSEEDRQTATWTRGGAQKFEGNAVTRRQTRIGPPPQTRGSRVGSSQSDSCHRLHNSISISSPGIHA